MSRNNEKDNKAAGFTLIELLVVISIISLIASVLSVSLTGAKSKAQDVATVASIHSLQTSFQSGMNESSGAPNPGSSTTYYCLGLPSTGTCTFWGQTFHGNDTVKSILAANGISTSLPSRPLVIDNTAYDGAVYKCASIVNGICNAAIYWTESSQQTQCAFGIPVLRGVGGTVCGQDAGAQSTNNVETTQNGSFDFTLAQPADAPVTCSANRTVQAQTTLNIALASGIPKAVTASVGTAPGNVSVDLTGGTCTPSTSCGVAVGLAVTCNTDARNHVGSFYQVQLNATDGSVQHTTTIKIPMSWNGPDP